MSQEIQTRGMLASVKLSAWSARKYDRKISNDVAESHGTTAEAGRYNKTLLPGDAASYKAILQHVSATRAEHYKQTLPWSDEGARLLPIANFDEYQKRMETARYEFNRLLSAFLLDYPALKDGARVVLNGMYREEDYPETDAIAGKFGFELSYLPMPSAGDFRVAIQQDELQRIRESVTDRVKSATAAATAESWNRLHAAVSHVAERLTTPGAIFRDSLTDNVRELCDVLRRLNITQDPDLERLRAEVEARIAPYDAQQLRDSEQIRNRVADAARGITSAIQTARAIRSIDDLVTA